MWYTKFDFITRSSKITCPNCGTDFYEQMFYTIEPRPCDNCSASLVFIRTIRFLYVIDLEKSSGLFKTMHNYLIDKSPRDVSLELEQIFNLFTGEGKWRT